MTRQWNRYKHPWFGKKNAYSSYTSQIKKFFFSLNIHFSRQRCLPVGTPTSSTLQKTKSNSISKCGGAMPKIINVTNCLVFIITAQKPTIFGLSLSTILSWTMYVFMSIIINYRCRPSTRKECGLGVSYQTSSGSRLCPLYQKSEVIWLSSLKVISSLWMDQAGRLVLMFLHIFLGFWHMSMPILCFCGLSLDSYNLFGCKTK